MKRRLLSLAMVVLVLATLAPPAAKAQEFEPFWVMTLAPAQLWTGAAPDAASLGAIAPWRYLAVVSPPIGPRALVYDHRAESYGYVDANLVAGVQPPNEDELAENIGPPLLSSPNLPGRIVSETDVRRWPRVEEFTFIRKAQPTTAVWAWEAVQGDDGETWYRLNGREYVPASAVRLPRPVDETRPGRWIDADLQIPTLVTAYEGDVPVYAALAIPGLQAYQTPTGTFEINRRVENEIMDSSTIGIPRNGPDGYYLEDVLFTQYFTDDGASLHYNWWRSTFGYPGSRGCLGLNLEDSRWFWDWASIGTTVVIHE